MSDSDQTQGEEIEKEEEQLSEQAEGSNFPSITPETANNKDALLDYMPLAEMVARKELNKMPSHLADFRELVNLGLIKINSLIADAAKKNQTYNPSYIIQGIVWAIKNRNRKDATQRGEFKSSLLKTQQEVLSPDGLSYTLQEIQEAVIETVVALDDDKFELADPDAVDPSESAAISEMHQAVRRAVALLPDNYRDVIQLRFFKGMKGKDIAAKLGVSSARVTRIIQDATAKMRGILESQKLTDGVSEAYAWLIVFMLMSLIV